jgi:ApeA N-terminal domain 1
MEKQKAYLGYWWIPESEDPPCKEDMVVGLISINASDEVFLEIQSLDKDTLSIFSRSNFSVIHGIIENDDGSNFVTLLDCRQKGYSFPAYGLASYRYSVNFVLLHPCRHIQQDSLGFRKIKFRHDKLFDWVGRNSMDYDDELNPKQKEIPPIQATINEAQISILNEVIPSGSRKILKYKQFAWVEIENSQPLSIEEWFDKFISPIGHFLTLATDVENTLISLYVFLDEIEDDRYSKMPLEVIVARLRMEEDITSPTLFDSDIIFKYKDIVEEGYLFDSILTKWFALFDRVNTNNDNLVYLYTANKYVKGYQETAFLNVSQALELYFDNILKQKISTSEPRSINENLTLEDLNNIKSIFDNFSEQLSPAANKWMDDKINYALKNIDKQLLFDKLKAMFTNVESLSQDFSNGNDIDELCKKLKNTRNYYTHYGKDWRSKAATKEDLYWLTQSISYLLLYFLLIEVGFKESDAIKMLRRNDDYDYAKDKIKEASRAIYV